LVVIAPSVRDAALRLLLANRQARVLDGVLALRAPLHGEQQIRVLEDLASLTGGRCILAEVGESLAAVSMADLGTARQVWATRDSFGILGGGGSRQALGDRVRMVRGELRATTDDDLRELVRERLAKLVGTAAVVRVGAASPSEQVDQRVRLQAGVRVARAALDHGVVPGGGLALIRCIPVLDDLAARGDVAAGMRALSRALEAPLRAIATNAGCEPGMLLYAARGQTDHTFDAVRRAWVDAQTDGPLDVLDVVRTALHAAVSAGVEVLLSEVIIHRRNPPLSLTP
jgi:chaperonin GroEL